MSKLSTKEKEQDELLTALSGNNPPSSDQFKKLVTSIENHTVLAKVFLLEGPPFVFSESPMKYVIFREQVAERFDVGSQDVCIVGSAKLGFSPSAEKYGRPFQETSDVDVVIISEELFHKGSGILFKHLNYMAPSASEIKKSLKNKENIDFDPKNIATIKDAIRNYTFNNFNPGLLPDDNSFRQEMFEKISSTSGLFLALKPQVFVSKIRCRIFKTWKSAEDYYANSLRQLSAYLSLDKQDAFIEDDAGEILSS